MTLAQEIIFVISVLGGMVLLLIVLLSYLFLDWWMNR